MHEALRTDIGRLSEAKTKKAFEDCDWLALRSHLDFIGLDQTSFDELLGHLRRASKFIHRYPNPKQDLRRDAFLNDLQEYVRVALGESAAQRVAEEGNLLLQVERGYRSILAMLDKAEISILAPDVRVAAYLSYAVGAYADVMAKHDRTVRALKQLTFPNGPFIQTDGGGTLSLDAVINSIVTALSTSIIMESHKNHWHDAADIVSLPPLPAVSDANILNAGSTLALAMCWNRWQRAEERKRFFGGTLEEFAPPNLPSWALPGTATATEYTPIEGEFFDYAANERVLDRLGQQYMEVMTETDVPDRVSGIGGPLPLLPTGIVSLEELHAASALGDILNYNVMDDTERPGGLRLVEWVRGYAVLQKLASDSYKADKTAAGGLTTIVARADLLSTLVRCGLRRPVAERFIEQAMLKTSSEDLFDSPLIQMQDGNLIVFGPALVTANLTVVVLSTVASLNEPLSRKGHSLETAIVSLLQRRGLHARGFKVTRDGEEYEYDAVLAWGDYVFVLECKNRSLSGNRPVNAYYFDLGIKSAVRQAKRLADALRKYPDILATEMKVSLDSKTVVPCVLNSLPYARTGDIDGVYCTDSSVLARFLSERYFFIKSPYRIRKGATIVNRVPIVSLWQEDQPRPEDLLKQLREPLQLKLLKAHTKRQTRIFPIGPAHLVASTEFVREAWSIDSVARTFGLSGSSVRRTLDSVRQQLRQAKRRIQKKRRRKARKPK
jgi:hypothetical protein